MLDRNSILAVQDLPLEKVLTPEWGQDSFVFVRTLTGIERDAFESELVKDRKPNEKTNIKNIRAKLAVKCVCNEAGERLFTDADAEALGAKSAKVLDRIFSTAQRLNSLGEKEVEALSGN